MRYAITITTPEGAHYCMPPSEEHRAKEHLTAAKDQLQAAYPSFYFTVTEITEE